MRVLCGIKGTDFNTYELSGAAACIYVYGEGASVPQVRIFIAEILYRNELSHAFSFFNNIRNLCFRKMQVANPNNIKIYNLSAGKSLPEWLSDRKKRSLQRQDGELRRRIELMQVAHAHA